ncbi:MAG: hypothetical protein ACRDS0_03570 [Pseudonocardiaceae bacterium]
MHHLDRVMLEADETGSETENAEQQQEEEEFRELLDELMYGESGQPAELVQESFDTAGAAGEFDDRSAREITLASELLEVQSAAELEQFLGNLLRRVAGAGRKFAGSDTGRALGGILKQAASQALPAIGGAMGTQAAPEPGDLGGQDGTPAGSVLGLELEGLSREDREFEVARAFVRFAGAAARLAAEAPQLGHPTGIANAAVSTAARRYLPGLLAPPPAGSSRARQHSGRWVRQGNSIVVNGA